MDPEDTRYMCPRPRALRACVSCKAHKTRCLPSAHSNHCQRCEKVGTLCSYTNAQASRKNNRLAQRLKASTSQPVNTGSVLDHIFAQLPPASLDIPYEDESEKVLQLHCNFFGSHQRDSSTPGRQPVDTGREPAGVNRQDRPYVTMSQVDRMMQIFHTQKEYFPFVIIAENTTAETLRQKWPFLLLSVLVVASAADPVLQKLLDEQFRKVLATRVVMQGEKSLDYVQGLLVYLAWHPINLRPINNQMWQYMQLAIAMVSDLNLESTIESTLDPPEDQMIARNIILGCYFLSSSIAMDLKRPKNFTFNPSDELVTTMFATNDLSTHTIASTTLLCKFIERIHNCDLETDIADYSGMTECPLQNITQGYLQELKQIEGSLPTHVNTNIKIQLMRKFARVRLYALALGKAKPPLHSQRTISSQHPLRQINSLSYLQKFSSCFTEISGLIEFFIGLSTEDCRKLTFYEWTMLISTIIIFPRLYKFTITDMGVAAIWQDLIVTERVAYISRIERLHEHMENASTTKLDTQNDNSSSYRLPDLFYLFSTVLKLFLNNFVRDSTNSHPIQLPPGNDRPTGRAKSQCPVMNGEIKKTDCWDLLMHNDPMEPFDAEAAAEFNINDPLYFDLNSWIDFSV